MPEYSSMNKCHVDKDNETLLIPFNNKLMPIHIATIKSAKTQEQENLVYLKLIFHCPGVGMIPQHIKYTENDDYV